MQLMCYKLYNDNATLKVFVYYFVATTRFLPAKSIYYNCLIKKVKVRRRCWVVLYIKNVATKLINYTILNFLDNTMKSTTNNSLSQSNII